MQSSPTGLGVGTGVIEHADFKEIGDLHGKVAQERFCTNRDGTFIIVFNWTAEPGMSASMYIKVKVCMFVCIFVPNRKFHF